MALKALHSLDNQHPNNYPDDCFNGYKFPHFNQLGNGFPQKNILN